MVKHDYKPSFKRFFELQVEVKLVTWVFLFYCKHEPQVTIGERDEGHLNSNFWDILLLQNWTFVRYIFRREDQQLQ